MPITEFLPIFTVGTFNKEDKTSGSFDAHINDEEYYTFYFTQHSDDDERLVQYAAVNCVELINGWTKISDEERNSFISQIPLKKDSLCPNMTEFRVKGELFGKTMLQLRINPTKKATRQRLIGVVALSTITRDFDPSFYEKYGF